MCVFKMHACKTYVFVRELRRGLGEVNARFGNVRFENVRLRAPLECIHNARFAKRRYLELLQND